MIPNIFLLPHYTIFLDDYMRVQYIVHRFLDIQLFHISIMILFTVYGISDGLILCNFSLKKKVCYPFFYNKLFSSYFGNIIT